MAAGEEDGTMGVVAGCLVAVAAGYLIGAIPFGLLIGRWFGGVDIRTVGSGNIGATNVRRVLGWPGFFAVMLLDGLKAFAPIQGFPRLVEWHWGSAAVSESMLFAWLPALVALAAILGHNFPVYLGFRGGKGVASSLGAMFALDAAGAGIGVLGFLATLGLSGYVSLASLAGATAFVVNRFGVAGDPWSRDRMATSVLTIALYLMMLYRHRGNLSRIARGEEPRISDRRKGKSEGGGESVSEAGGAGRAGRVRTELVCVLGLGLLAAGVWSHGRWLWSAGATSIKAGGASVRLEGVLETGNQRAERVLFRGDGGVLAATCPRYGKLALFDLGLEGAGGSIGGAGEGRVVDAGWHALELAAPGGAGSEGTFWALRSPLNDRRHVEEGGVVELDWEGVATGRSVATGYYAKGMSVLGEGRLAVASANGAEEGDVGKGAAELWIVDTEGCRVVGRWAIPGAGAGNGPERVAATREGDRGVVTLRKGAFLFFRAEEGGEALRFEGRWDSGSPASAVCFTSGGALIAGLLDGRVLWFEAGGGEPRVEETGRVAGGYRELPELGLLAETREDGSELAFRDSGDGRALGSIRVPGASGVGGSRAMGVDWNAATGRLAVANAAGGSVRLLRARASSDRNGR